MRFMYGKGMERGMEGEKIRECLTRFMYGKVCGRGENSRMPSCTGRRCVSKIHTLLTLGAILVKKKKKKKKKKTQN